MTERYLLNAFNKHYADVYGVYEPVMVIKDIRSGNSLQERRDLLNLLCYQKWIERYNCMLNSTSIIDVIEEYSAFEKDKEVIQYHIENDYRKEIRCWQDFYEKNKQCDHRMKFIATMDVEGFDKYDPRAIHTAYNQDELIEQLVYGRYSEQCTLEKLVTLKEVPFTFFVEIYSDIYKNNSEISKILKLCDSGRNEAGLHCHPFSLSKEILEELQIPYFAYRTAEGIDKIIHYGQEIFRHALGKDAFSYRAGSFEVYSKYLEILYNNGIRVDSSLYNQSIYNHSVYQNYIYNLPVVQGGVMEVPVTTFYDVKGHVLKFDLNMMNFQQKLEAIVKNMIYGTYVMTMICHSWSFSKAVRFIEGGKLYHKYFDEYVWDEFQYIVEFMIKQSNVDFITMREVVEALGMQAEHRGEYLVDINGQLKLSPTYALPPTFGQMRELNPTGFLDMREGVINATSHAGGGYKTSSSCVLCLDPYMTPKVGDCATYVLCAKTMPMIQYNLKFLMEIPYYRRKMEAHRRIRCCVYINKQLVYYQFATDPWFKDVISITFCASGEKTEVKFVMECVQSEESWVRGAAFKVWIRNLHLELSHDKKTEWVWKNLQLDRFSCLSEGISFTESEKDELIVKQSAHSGVCYFETFDGGVNTPPGEKYFGDSKITPGEWVHINFKGRVKKVESKILTLFLIQYNANSHERLGSISHEIKLSEVFGFYSIRMQVMPKATDYKLCFRTEGEKIDIYINLSEFEVLQIQDIDFKEKL